MPGPEGNGEFCFPESRFVSRNIEIRGKQIHCFRKDQLLSDLLNSFLRCGKKHSLKNAMSTRGKYQSHLNRVIFCHVSMNRPINARVVLRKTSAL